MSANLEGLGPGILGLVIVLGLVALWISAMVSIFRRSTAMSGLELLGWCGLVLFAQFVGPLIWFLVGRERYAVPPAR